MNVREMIDPMKPCKKDNAQEKREEESKALIHTKVHSRIHSDVYYPYNTLSSVRIQYNFSLSQPHTSLVASIEGRTSSDALGVPVLGIRGGRDIGRGEDGGGGRVSVSDEGCGLCVFSFCSATASVEGSGRVLSSISYVGSVESAEAGVSAEVG